MGTDMKISSILVAIDSSTGAKSIVKAAVNLAYMTNAKLQAIYIEESDWFEVSRMSFSRQISSYTGELIPYTEKHITDQSRALGSLLERLITGLSEKRQIEYSFQMVRGSANEKLLAAAADFDMVMIGRTRQPGKFKTHIGSTVRYMTDHCPSPVLIWNDESDLPGKVIGICTTPQQSMPVIEWTIALGKILEQEPSLFWSEKSLFPADKNNLANQIKKITPELADYILEISEIYPELNQDTLRYFTHQLLVMERNLFNPDRPDDFIGYLPNSVLLV